MSHDEVDHLVHTVAESPTAAVSLAVLLRHSRDLPVDHALAVESAVYSTLQAGQEFARWRSTTTPTIDDHPGATVMVDRQGDEMRVTLDRPDRHNAISRRLRDDLCSALAVAVADDSISRITVTGNGPSFCSGGDLAEFGGRSDPAIAHVVRLALSPARLMHDLAARTTVRIHGATLGGGIEIAAFAEHVVAHPDTRIGLPEVSLGLIPGAGGTVSLPRRIGRQRTAALALAIDHIDASTAWAWGLVDDIG